MKKIVLSEQGKDKLPPMLKFTMRQFMVKKVWWYEGHPPLEPAQGHGIHYSPKDEYNMAYASYCQDMLDAGKVDKGKGRSMLEGLKGCGPEGERIIEEIKTKVLK